MHIAEVPQLLKKLFLDRELHDINKIRLYINGAWEIVLLDCYIPCFPQYTPIYIYSRSNLWASLIEKALAKHFGGYERLSDVGLLQIYRILTGVPVNELELDNGEDLDHLYDILEHSFNKGYVMGAFSTKNSENDYFNKEAIYPIIAVFRYSQYKVIILRNIYMEIVFDGEYYRNSSKLPAEITTVIDKFRDNTIAMSILILK
jgi:hypothetical protein